jgi:hypothetical protein
MNANELADYLMNFIMLVEDYDESKHEKAATMLRQQQAEIEALKKEAALQRLSDFTQEVEAKYSDAWWKEVDEFNKQLKAQEK